MNKEEFQKALKSITGGLFGKQGAKRYERSHFPLRPLDQMLGNLAAVEPMEWFRHMFSRRPLNRRFTDEQRRSWIEQALTCGQEYTRKVTKEYKGSGPEVIAKAMGMKVFYPVYPEKTNQVLLAEYRIPDTICTYMDAVKKAEELLEKSEIGEILTEGLNISRLLLAHELFHNVEEKYKHEIYTKTGKIRLRSLDPAHDDSIIITLSEIAAMAFAEEITGIPYVPYVMGMFFVYSYSPKEASGLYEEMMEFTGLEPCAPGQAPGPDRSGARIESVIESIM